MASGIISLDSSNELIHILERGGEMMDYFVSRRVVDGCSKILDQMKTSLKVASGK